MEVDTENREEEKDLFQAAEEGNSSVFESLSPQSLSKSLSLRNEDVRSLLHVAASSGHSKVPFSPSSNGSLPFSFNLIKISSFLYLYQNPKLGFIVRKLNVIIFYFMIVDENFSGGEDIVVF